MLAWARKKSGLSIEDVAIAEKIEIAKLEGWERGDGTPTLAMLTRLARRYRYPLMVFYLSEPPKDFGVVRDFRILPNNVSRSFSVALRRAIRIAQERQAWASSYFEDAGIEKSTLVGTYSADDDATAIGKDLRGMLGATIAAQAQCGSPSGAFVFWRRLCEKAGIFVFQAGGVALEEMRGFSLPDPYAPAVVINSKDEFLPRTFTMIHEVAHILIGESAITGAGPRVFSVAPKRQAERFCNQVAAEVLVPSADLLGRVTRDWMNRESEVLRQLQGIYWVSRSVIALRLFEVGLASQSYVIKRLRRPPTPKQPKEPPRIPESRKAVGRVGESFSRTALEAYRDGSIHAGQLSALLNLKLRHLPKLEQIVSPERVQPITKSAS
jgi:Zn-dependent peptidase ImmA (M78 family)/transcriptional regulator with XRE-family HTH domain